MSKFHNLSKCHNAQCSYKYFFHCTATYQLEIPNKHGKLQQKEAVASKIGKCQFICATYFTMCSVGLPRHLHNHKLAREAASHTLSACVWSQPIDRCAQDLLHTCREGTEVTEQAWRGRPGRITLIPDSKWKEIASTGQAGQAEGLENAFEFYRLIISH